MPGDRLLFGDGHPIIAIEIDKRGIDVFPAAIDDYGVFGDRQTGSGADDQAVADDQGSVGQCRCAILYDGGVGKGITMLSWIGHPINGEGGLRGGEERMTYQ